jgi:hypothetical protein
VSEDCVIAPVKPKSNGYAYVYVRSSGYGKGDWREELAHRWAWMQEYGPIPEGLHVHHTCENRVCVNVDHMELLRQCDHNGAAGHGRLTEEQARKIRWLAQGGFQGKIIAEVFGCSPQLVSGIKKGRAWANA